MDLVLFLRAPAAKPILLTTISGSSGNVAIVALSQRSSVSVPLISALNAMTVSTTSVLRSAEGKPRCSFSREDGKIVLVISLFSCFSFECVYVLWSF